MLKRSEITAAIIVAAAGIIAAIIGIYPFLNDRKPSTPAEEDVLPLQENKESNLCLTLKERASKLSEKVDDKAIRDTNRRQKINTLYWQDRLESISKYDCEEIKADHEMILKSFEKATKQLDL